MSYATYATPEQVHAAADHLEAALINNFRKVNERIGSPQFVQSKSETDHVGTYATSAVVEALTHRLTLDKSELVMLLGTLRDAVTVEGNERDSRNTFKICAVINALAALHSRHKNNDVKDAMDLAVARLVDIRNRNTEGFGWPCAAGIGPYSKHSRDVVPTAYAVISLRQANFSGQLFDDAVAYLARQVRAYLHAKTELRLHELVAAASALRTLNATDRGSVVSTRDLEQVDGVLYRNFVQSVEFREEQVSFVTSTDVQYKTSFFVMKTDLAILEYFCRCESPYLKSSRVNRRISHLATEVIRERMYRSPGTGQPFTRTNVKVLRILRFQEQLLKSFVPSRLWTFYFDHQWEHSSNPWIVGGRYVTLAVIVGVIPFAYLSLPSVSSGDKVEYMASIGAGMCASFLYAFFTRARG